MLRRRQSRGAVVARLGSAVAAVLAMSSAAAAQTPAPAGPQKPIDLSSLSIQGLPQDWEPEGLPKSGPGDVYSVLPFIGRVNFSGPSDIYFIPEDPSSPERDGVVTFDGIEEPLIRYWNGTQPLVVEESRSQTAYRTSLTLTMRSADGGDLFPALQGPSGVLPDAFIVLGFDALAGTFDGPPLDWPDAARAVSLYAIGYSNGVVVAMDAIWMPSLVGTTWDGRMVMPIRGATGRGIDEVTFRIVLRTPGAGDFNDDLLVDEGDLATFLGELSSAGGPANQALQGDLNGDGAVSMADFASMQQVCATGSCRDMTFASGSLVPGGDAISQFHEENGLYIGAASAWVALHETLLAGVLWELGQIDRIHLLFLRNTIATAEFDRATGDMLLKLDFLDDNPPLRLQRVQDGSFVYLLAHYGDVQVSHPIYSWSDNNPYAIANGLPPSAAFAQDVRALHGLMGHVGTAFTTYSAVVGLVTVTSGIAWENFFDNLGWMFVELYPADYCASAYQFVNDTIGWCFGNWSDAAMVGAVYACFYTLDIPYFLSDPEREIARDFYFWLGDQARMVLP